MFFYNVVSGAWTTSIAWHSPALALVNLIVLDPIVERLRPMVTVIMRLGDIYKAYDIH